MQAEHAERVPHDASQTIAAADLSSLCSLSLAEIEELMADGVLTPLSAGSGGMVFSAACVMPLRQACAMRERFDLDLFTVGLLFAHLDRIAALEERVRRLQAHIQWPGGPAPANQEP